jgi:hypothetical protein
MTIKEAKTIIKTHGYKIEESEEDFSELLGRPDTFGEIQSTVAKLQRAFTALRNLPKESQKEVIDILKSFSDWDKNFIL